MASPQTGRFTREVESDIDYVNSIDAVKTLVASSLIFELKRANIDFSQSMFAGLMVYGPSTGFNQATVKEHTHGLFLQEAGFKKWWLSVWKTIRKPGDMVKIAFVIWDANEAAAKKAMAPSFWTNAISQVFGDHLEKLELKPLDIDVEEGCRAYVKMQKQVQDGRIENIQVSKERAELETRVRKLVASQTLLTSIANAVGAGNMKKATQLVDQWKQAPSTKAKKTAKQSITKGKKGTSRSIEVFEEDSDEDDKVPDGQGTGDEGGLRGEEGGDGAEEVEEVDDPNDSDYAD